MALTTTKQRRVLGERLRDERERLGYTELQIAQLLGIPLEQYQAEERGEVDPGLFSMPRLDACGFDVLFIVTGTRNKPVQEESELLQRFRELSAKGRASIFMTLDALERLAPNLRQRIRQKIDDTFKDY
ncbi:MAG: XRE family transcriptional regulator [Duodenibacillus sp.]|nr:XRE family transcriptional regulator [Duodenibacillus sp.]HBC70238.1 transcriptional regulator [Sutterella sp.]